MYRPGIVIDGKYMPLILLWGGLALLLEVSASANGRSFWGWFILGLIIDPILAGLLYLAYCKGPHMKTFLRLFGKFTRWYITLGIFMACLLLIIAHHRRMAGFWQDTQWKINWLFHFTGFSADAFCLAYVWQPW